MARQREREDAVRITSAAPSAHEDLRRRQKRYLISMSLRSACFVGAVVAGLAITASASFAHDIYNGVIKHGQA